MRRWVRGVTLWVLALGTAFGGVYAITGKLRNPLEVAARNYLDCFERRDAGCMMKYVSSAEEDQMGLSRDSLQEFLDEYVSVKLKGFRGVGSPKLNPGSHRLQTGISQTYAHPDGRWITLYVSLWQMGDERAAQIVRPLWMLVQGAQAPAGSPVNTSLGGRTMLHNLRGDLPILEKLRLKGFVSHGVVMQDAPSNWDTLKNLVRKPPKPRGLVHMIVDEVAWRQDLEYIAMSPAKRSAYSAKIHSRKRVEVYPAGVEVLPVAAAYTHEQRIGKPRDSQGLRPVD